MSEHHSCSQKETIAEIKKDMQSIKNAIKGNGKPGLEMAVAQLSQNTEFLSQQVNEATKIQSSMITAVNAFRIFQAEVETAQKLKDKYQRKRDHANEVNEAKEYDQEKFGFTKKHLIAVLVATSLFGLGGIVLSIITLLQNAG